MRKSILLIFSFILLFSSCSKNGNSEITGIPFQESEKGLWSMISTDGEVLFSDEFKSQPTVVKEDMFMVKNENNLWEIYKADKKPKKIGTEYVSATLFQDGIALVAERNKPVSMINTDGKVIKVLDKIDNKDVGQVYAFNEGYAIYRAGDYEGVIDKNGNSIIPANYCVINNCSDGKFIAIDKKYEKAFNADSTEALKFSVLSTKGKLLFEINGAKYCQVGSFSNGYLPVCVKKDGDKMWGIINEKQEFVVKPSAKIKQISQIKDDKFIYSNGSGWGMMDIKGNTIIRAKYDGLTFDVNGKLLAYTKTEDGKESFKFIDESDNKIGNDTYLSTSTFGLLDGEHALVKITDTQWSLINNKAEQLENLPDMVNISFNCGDGVVVSDYVDINAMLDKIGINKDGMDGITFSDTPKNTVSKIAQYIEIGTKKNPTTSPYWYDYRSDLSYFHEVDNIYPNFGITFSGKLSRQTYRTKRVIDYSFYDYYWYHDEKFPTGYVWNKVSIKSFHITFDNSGRLLGKLKLVYNELTKRFKNMGKVEKENDGAAVITLKNGKTAFIYMNSKEVHVIWGNIGSASSINIEKYKGIKEDMGTTEEAPTGIRWDFETNKDNNLIDTVDVDSCFADSVAPC